MAGKPMTPMFLGIAPASFPGQKELWNRPELARNADSFFVRVGTRQVRLLQREIHYLESSHDTVIVHLRDAKHVVRTSLKQFAERLTPGAFTQVHRAFIVRLDLIATIRANHLTMDNMTNAIPIGQQYRALLFQHLMVT